MTMHLGEATIASGASGSEVKSVQQILSGQGYDVGPIDGLFGPQTHKAVQSFQSSHGLVPDGIIGPLTWAALKGQQPASTGPSPSAPLPVAQVKGLGFMESVGLYVIAGLALLVTLGGGSKRRGKRKRK